jgi:PAS domain S-box-containing protein
MSHPSPIPGSAATEPPLPDEEGLFRTLFLTAFDAMALSEAGRFVDANEAALRIFGYTREEVIGMSLARCVAPQHLAALAANIATNREFTAEFRLIRKDGTEFDAEVQAKTITFGGRSLRLSVLRDITERRQSAESLLDSRAKLGLALGLARLGQWEMDVASGLFTLDDDFLKLLGTSAEREGGHQMAAAEYARRFVPPDEAAIVAEEIGKAIATADPHFTRQLEHQFIRADGSLGVMLVRFAIVKDAAGRTVRTYGVNQDITEQKVTEQQRVRLGEQLQQAQKMEALGTLAGGIAHDFNNILTGILGHLQLATMDLPAGHPARNGVDEAAKAGRRARDLVARILAFSRSSQHERKPAALGPVVDEVLHLLRASLPATIRINRIVAPDCPPVLCDAAQIHQVIMNLGTNAAHAMRQHGGVLTVELGGVVPSDPLRRRYPQINPTHTIRLSVRDTGTGMDSAVLARIFEPFYTTKATGEGSGLGLTMVYSILEDHLAAIVVASTPGAGTAFDLYFSPAPAAAVTAPAAPASLRPALAPFGRDRPLMLVDDDEDVRAVGITLLRRLGFRPVAFADPAAALSAFRVAPDHFCAAISDLTMPGMTGWELAREILALRPQLPLVLASGNLNTGAERHGVQHTIRKPFDLEELASLLRQLLHEPAA